jgi:hypothetical protein
LGVLRAPGCRRQLVTDGRRSPRTGTDSQMGVRNPAQGRWPGTLSTIRVDFNLPHPMPPWGPGSAGPGSAGILYVAVIGDREAAGWPDTAGPPGNAGAGDRGAGARGAGDRGAGDRGAGARGAGDRGAGGRGAGGRGHDGSWPGGPVAVRLRDGRHLDAVPAERLIRELSRQVTERSADLGFR